VDAAALAELPIFNSIPPPERDRFVNLCADLVVEAGTTLVTEGDFGFAMFVIREGTADVIQSQIVLRSLGPGDVFGEIAVLSSGRRTATVVARTPMRLVTLLNRDVWRLERECPELGTALRASIAEYLER
jgi:CRP-like cAMP-binding protein